MDALNQLLTMLIHNGKLKTQDEVKVRLGLLFCCSILPQLFDSASCITRLTLTLILWP